MDTKQASELLEQVLFSAAYQSQDAAEHRMCMAYYNGYQETPELRAYREELGRPAHTPNLFQKYVNTVLGMEEQQRVDWMVSADDDDAEDVAEGANQLLNEVARLHDVNHHMAEAFKPMAITGQGWIYFAKNTDPMDLEYECSYIPNSEILWDRRSRKLDLSDCKFVARRRFVHEDEASGLFPEHKELIKRTYSSLDDWGPINAIGDAVWAETDSRYVEHLFREPPAGRRQVAIIDVYYRSFEERNVIFLPNGMKAEYDPENPMHTKEWRKNHNVVQKRFISVMRNAWYIGNYLVSDDVSPHPHRMFPYVNLRGNMEEDTGVVFALGRTLMAPQDSYNAAHVQMHALMEKVTVIVNKGALTGTGQTVEDIQREAHKGDGVIITNEKDGIKLEHHYQQIQHLQVLMQEAERAMESASGISNSLTGQQDQNKSGVAQQVQVEQATITLSDLFSNYFFARQQLGRLMLAHIIDKVGLNPMKVNFKSETGQVRKTIDLNQRTENGEISNALPMARMRVVLDDVETSKGYRAQQLFMLQQTAAAAPDEIKPHMYLAMMKLSNIPQRHELIEDMQKMLGKGETEEQQAEMDQAASQQQQDMLKLEMDERKAEIELKLAQAAKARADAKAALMPDQQVADANQDAANDERERKLALVKNIREEVAKRAV